MSLRLYYHPLSSYCWKALIALYEAERVPNRLRHGQLTLRRQLRGHVHFGLLT